MTNLRCLVSNLGFRALNLLRFSSFGFRISLRVALPFRLDLAGLAPLGESEMARFRGLCPAQLARAARSARTPLGESASRLPEPCRLGSGLVRFLRALGPAYPGPAPNSARVG